MPIMDSMINQQVKFTQEYYFNLIRPLPEECTLGQYDMPIIRRPNLAAIDVDQLCIISWQNFRSANEIQCRNSLLSMFCYDDKLETLWRNPRKYIPQLMAFELVATPDFSIYPGMNLNAMRNNVYRNRYLGALWQAYGVNVIPTVGWCGADNDDICFAGIEYGSAIAISTIGCKNDVARAEFIRGFKCMKRLINPELIIVVGGMIEGMTGNFINYSYMDGMSFSINHWQLTIDGIGRAFEVKEDV